MSFVRDSSGVLRLGIWDEIPWLAHGFTTRETGNFERVHSLGFLGAALGLDGMELRTVRQVHSSDVFLVNSEPAADRPEADALVTNVPGALLAVRTADCIPILLVDAGKQAVAVVHAGWRGSAKKIAARTVARMSEDFGCDPEDFVVAVGPGIGQCCFEVGSEVAEQFDARHVSFQQKAHIDLEAANRDQLVAAGVSSRRIHGSGLCTHCDGQQFFSYRREGERAGRMLGFVGIRQKYAA